MRNIKELIRREIERRKNKAETMQERGAYLGLIDFLGTLPDESEKPAIGYDEAYLNEKIAKASKSWEGVDVDKFMDEIRGHEPVTDCHDLEEAAEEYATTHLRNNEFPTADSAFKAGAEWQKAKMMEGAVEGEVREVYRDDDGIHCCVSVGTDYKPGTIVYVITIQKEDKKNEQATSLLKDSARILSGH